MNNLNPEQLRILRHMLGIDEPAHDRPKPYRNYYCANPGDPKLVELARLGTVRLYDTRGGYEWWECTDIGRVAAMASHKTIRYPAAKRRYIRFLEVSDCLPDLTFREFLTDPRYRETRA